jgi:polysaccharide biosynthesis PFTS motif protein
LESNNFQASQDDFEIFLNASGSNFWSAESISVLKKSLKQAHFTVTFFLFITILFIFAKVKHPNISQQRKFLVVFSLSSRQLDNADGSEGITEFLSEKRFQLPVENSHLLIEEKNIRGVFRKDRRVVPSIWLKMFWNYSDISEKRVFFKSSIIHYRQLIKSKYFCKSNSIFGAYALLEHIFWKSIRNKDVQCVTSQSSMTKLPAPFLVQNKNFILHMFWYSTNSSPIVRTGLEAEAYRLNSELANPRILHHVWNASSQNFLYSQSIKNVCIQGSILFTPRKEILTNLGENAIVYFDVTPFKNSENYYSDERMIANIVTLCDLRKQFEIETNIRLSLYLKPKRRFTKLHSDEYLKKLRELQKIGELELLSEDLNLYGLVKESKLILGSPFTSPVILANEMKIPSAYIDFGLQDYILPNVNEGVDIFVDKIKLKSYIRDVLTY